MAGLDHPRAREEVFEAQGGVLGDLTEGAADHVPVGGAAVGVEAGEILEDAADHGGVVGGAFELELVAADVDVHVEQRFQEFKAFLLLVEQKLEALGIQHQLDQYTVLPPVDRPLS